MSLDLTKRLYRYRASSIMNNSAEFATKVMSLLISLLSILSSLLLFSITITATATTATLLLSTIISNFSSSN